MTKNKRIAVLVSIVLAAVAVCGPRVSAGDGCVIAAGTPLGVRFHTDGVVITGITGAGESGEESPASAAGLRRGDIIKKVNGKSIQDAKALCGEVSRSGGEEIEISFLRSGREQNTKAAARRDENGEYKLGLWVRDGASGIGTVTYIDPESREFAGLGHGICDPESGLLLPMKNGDAEEVELTGINPGASGAPGELRGFFSGKSNGIITLNTESGVFGRLNALPENLGEELYEIGKKASVHEGEAYIITTVDGDGRQKYGIEISKLNAESGQKNFTVRVTDEKLLSKTGGIVQGMSGSPIIQDGKLVGAVTHVLIGDPALGYGIFIENMINASHPAVTDVIAA